MLNENLFISKNCTIIDAIQKINSNSRQAVCVIDEEGKLIGLVSDGDIRRALANGVALDGLIADYMNKSPRFLTKGAGETEIQALMLKYQVSQIPIVDGNGKLVALETHQSILEKEYLSNQVILMAGGKGSRLYPLTQETPKPLIPIAGRPIVEMIIKNFLRAGYGEFTISVNYLADQIKDYLKDGRQWNASIDYLDETKATGTAGSLALLPERPTEPFFIMNADILTNVNFSALRQKHIDDNNVLTVCARTIETPIAYGVLESNGDRISKCVEKPTLRHQVNAGVYMANPEVLDIIGDQERFYNMTDLIDECLERDLRIGIFNIHEYWRDIGQLADLELARNEYDENFS